MIKRSLESPFAGAESPAAGGPQKRKGVLERLVPLLRRAGKKAEARARQTTASPRPPDDPV